MALSHEMQKLFTQVGPGTPCGELLRRYWMPIWPAAELTPERPKKRVRLLGEDLVVFRDGGRKHRIAPRAMSAPQVLAVLRLRRRGRAALCLSWLEVQRRRRVRRAAVRARQRTLKKLACRPHYKVQQLAGILFAYIGPAPAPLLPRWELMVRKDGTRSVVVLPIHQRNWVQAQENSHDPVHTFYLQRR